MEYKNSYGYVVQSDLFADTLLTEEEYQELKEQAEKACIELTGKPLVIHKPLEKEEAQQLISSLSCWHSGHRVTRESAVYQLTKIFEKQSLFGLLIRFSSAAELLDDKWGLFDPDGHLIAILGSLKLEVLCEDYQVLSKEGVLNQVLSVSKTLRKLLE